MEPNPVTPPVHLRTSQQPAGLSRRLPDPLRLQHRDLNICPSKPRRQRGARFFVTVSLRASFIEASEGDPDDDSGYTSDRNSSIRKRSVGPLTTPSPVRLRRGSTAPIDTVHDFDDGHLHPTRPIVCPHLPCRTGYGHLRLRLKIWKQPPTSPSRKAPLPPSLRTMVLNADRHLSSKLIIP
jgi:hypothetical protein